MDGNKQKDGSEQQQVYRIGMTLNVKQGKIKEYMDHHANVWPEVEKALKESGLRNLNIFQFQDRQLFYYAEFTYSSTVKNEDLGRKLFEEAMKEYAEKPKVKEWEDLMHNYQEKIQDSNNGNDSKSVWWLPMQPVYHLD